MSRMARMKLTRRLCCGLPGPRLDIDASRFWGLETRLNGDSEVSCAPESDPLVDFGLKFFTVGDNVEYPPGATCQDHRRCKVQHGWSGKCAGCGVYMLGS